MCNWTVLNFVFLSVVDFLSIVCAWDVLLGCAKICIFVGYGPFEHKCMCYKCANEQSKNTYLSVLSINACALNMLSNSEYRYCFLGSN